ncbi:MAG: hypothetical protein JXQ72_00010, partial [Anaerolineae bacterium]|nr:hypothetical protein [Anaerolineae bacterium]
MTDKTTPPRRAPLWALAGLVLAIWGGIGVWTADECAAWIVPATLGALAVSLILTASAVIPHPLAKRAQAAIRAAFGHPARAAGIVIVLLAVWVRLLWADRIIDLPALKFYLPFALVWPWLVIAYLMATSDPQRHKLSKFTKIAAMLGFWTLIIVMVLEVLLRVAVFQLPPKLRAQSAPALLILLGSRDVEMMPPQVPIREYWWAGKEQDFTYEPTDGDLFSETCLSEDPPPSETALDVAYTYDEHGFRGEPSGPVDLVVVGDSFTQAHVINSPFWDGIADSVYAIGASASGSVEQELLLEAFGLPRDPQVVVMAFYEGNDLQDSWKFHEARERYESSGGDRNPLALHSQFRPARFLMTYNLLVWLADELKPSGDCPFPVTDAYGHRMGYYPASFSLMMVDADTLRTSEIYAVTRDAILDAAAKTEAQGATFVLMFIPNKAHTHW